MNLRSIWHDLPPLHRRYLLLNTIVIAAIVNLIINGAIAWLSVLQEEDVPVWAVPVLDRPSTAVDTIGTLFLLPLITCLAFTTLARRDLREGRLPPLGWTHASHPFLGRLPAGVLRRGLVLGALAVALLAPLAVVALIVLDVGSLSVNQFVAYKAVFGVALGAVVTPVVALWAIAHAPPAQH